VKRTALLLLGFIFISFSTAHLLSWCSDHYNRA